MNSEDNFETYLYVSNEKFSILVKKKNSDKTNVRKDDRTPAEKEYDEKNEARELERLKKMAKLTHRETIDQYNNYLASLSEHHDVPKVGNAGMG